MQDYSKDRNKFGKVFLPKVYALNTEQFSRDQIHRCVHDAAHLVLANKGGKSKGSASSPAAEAKTEPATPKSEPATPKSHADSKEGAKSDDSPAAAAKQSPLLRPLSINPDEPASRDRDKPPASPDPSTLGSRGTPTPSFDLSSPRSPMLSSSALRKGSHADMLRKACASNVCNQRQLMCLTWCCSGVVQRQHRMQTRSLA